MGLFTNLIIKVVLQTKTFTQTLFLLTLLKENIAIEPQSKISDPYAVSTYLNKYKCK